MPKKKKTRKQKILAETRRQTQGLPTPGYSFESTPAVEKKETTTPLSPAAPTHPVSRPAIVTLDYQYLTTDLRKTTFFTGIIIVLELVLYMFTKGV